MSQLVCFWCCIYFTCWLWTVNSAGNVQFKYPNKNAANEVLFRTRRQGMAKAQQMCNKYTLWACNGTLLVSKKSATTTTTTSTTTTTTSTTTTTTPAAIITTTILEGPTDLVIDEGSTYLGIAESSTDLRIEESSTDLGIEESSTDLRMETFALEPEEHPFNLSVIFIATDIVRRKRSAPRQYPHMALLGYGEYPQIKWLCGASLISEEFVLSAAHCAYVNGNLATYVRLGEQNLDGVTNAEHFKDLPIKQTLVHPEYKPPLLYNDIALFKFERLSSFSSFIRPICLNILNDFNLQKVTAVRWGADEYGEQSHRLLDVEWMLVGVIGFTEAKDYQKVSTIRR